MMHLSQVEAGDVFTLRLKMGPWSKTLGCPECGIEPKERAGRVLGPFTATGADKRYVSALDDARNERIFHGAYWMFFEHICLTDWVEGIRVKYNLADVVPEGMQHSKHRKTESL